MDRLQLVKQRISTKPPIYSVAVGPFVKGETRVHRHLQSVNGLLQVPRDTNNLGQWWDQLVQKYQDHKIIENLSYKQTDRLSTNLGSWLFTNKHQKVYLYCLNSAPWTITDIASWKYGFITIPLYDTLGPQAFEHILKLTEGTLIVVTQSTCLQLANYLKKFKSNINTVLILDQPSQNSIKQLTELGLTLQTFKNISEKKGDTRRPQLKWGSHLSFCFTSGTTGLPKGVIYTHQNVVTINLSLKGHYQFKTTDVHLSYLPIAHSFERVMIWCCICFGANIQYAKHPMTQILKDLAITKPTTIPIVPRLLNKLYPVLKNIYDKEKNVPKIKGIFGGRLKKLVCGSAPVAPQVLTFFKEVLQCDVREGYGQTETTAASFITYQGDTNYGHVGGPNRALEFKLVDVPQMQYFANSNPPKGEICSRGPTIFIGYHKNKMATDEAIDSDGWNHSGDIGQILPNGALKVIDRKKNIHKLSQGEYVAPQKVQNIYLRCKYVAECFLHGDSLQTFNVAIVHPNLELLPQIAKNLGITQTNNDQLCLNQKVTEFILKQMNKQGKEDKLNGFQMAKKIKLEPKSFATVGVFTNTMKLQRHIARKVFETQIKNMYSIANKI